MIHGCQATGAESRDQDGHQKLLRFCVQGLVKLVKQKDKRNQVVVKKIMEILHEYTKVCSWRSGFNKMFNAQSV